MGMKKAILILIFLLLPVISFAQNKQYKGIIQEIKEENILVKIFSGKDSNVVEINSELQNQARDWNFKTGDRVIIEEFENSQEKFYLIIDYQRSGYLMFVFIIFSVLSLIVGKKYGFYSLLGMALSFFVIFEFILPQITAGKSPLFITILASVFLIPITFYLSHGINKKTHIAIVSTIITLIITALFTLISVNLANLTGFSSDEAMFLQIANQNINMRGILLSGIIIGFLGILDDVTVSQSGIVMQLKESDSSLNTMELYKKSMKIGRDHITSMINTLVLVYTGASMPLLLLFINSPQPIDMVLNREIIADEILRTLLGSIGLILAVPISTFFASIIADTE